MIGERPHQQVFGFADAVEGLTAGCQEGVALLAFGGGGEHLQLLSHLLQQSCGLGFRWGIEAFEHGCLAAAQ